MQFMIFSLIGHFAHLPQRNLCMVTFCFIITPKALADKYKQESALWSESKALTDTAGKGFPVMIFIPILQSAAVRLCFAVVMRPFLALISWIARSENDCKNYCYPGVTPLLPCWRALSARHFLRQAFFSSCVILSQFGKKALRSNFKTYPFTRSPPRCRHPARAA